MSLWNECRTALRQLRKSPGFTLVVVATLGLCIGANTAVFSVLDAVLVRDIPYPQPDRLALVVTRGPLGDLETSQTGGQFEIVRDRAAALDVAAYGGLSGINFSTQGQAAHVRQQRVSAGFFRVFGVAPYLGREFERSEDVPNGPDLVVLSYEFWERHFQGNRSAIGQAITLRGAPYTVVGIMPRGFNTQCWCGDAPGSTTEPADLWTPLRPSRSGEGSGSNYGVVARLRPGVSWVEASVQVQALSAALLKVSNSEAGAKPVETIVPLQSGLTGDIRHGILITWAAVLMVLLIGCVNIAGLLLTRSSMRQREVATRMALGAGRLAVLRLLLTESLFLALGGCAVGVGLGAFAIDALKRLGADRFALWRPIELDGRVLLAMAAISIVTSLVFGLAPAVTTSRIDIRSALMEGGRGAAGGRHYWTRSLLVAGQVALSLVLLVSAGLLVRTLRHLDTLKPGFDTRNVMAAEVSLQDARYQTRDAVNGLFTRSLKEMRRIPGVQSAAVALTLPYERPLNDGFKMLDGRDRRARPVEMIYATPGYFETVRIPLLRGRTFTSVDGAQNTPVVVVSESFAARYYGGDALGHRLDVGEIVGIVGDVQQHSGLSGRDGPLSLEPTVYVPAAQFPEKALPLIHTWFSPKWVVRTNGNSGGLAGQMQNAIASFDPLLPIASFQPVENLQVQMTRDERYRATLFAVLAALALLLAVIGLYGLMSQTIARRTRELGVRLALGATPQQVMAAVLRSGLGLTVTGALAGILLSLPAGRFLKHMLWGVEAGDPSTFAVSTAVLIAAAALAIAVPAARVLRLDPAETLRDE